MRSAAQPITTVLIVDNHPIVSAGCKFLFSNNRHVKIYEAASILSAVRIVDTIFPKVVVVDTDLPDGSGLEFISLVSSKVMGVILFSAIDSTLLAAQAINAGAKGFLPKSASPSDLREAILAVARGGTWLADRLAQQVAFARLQINHSTVELTLRERKVLKLVSCGFRSAEIGQELGVSQRTIDAVIAALRNKLDARTTSEIIRIAVELKLL